jgi:LacI family transcriptional regulator
MIKVKDIAKKCNVSIATVSKALSNSSELKPETIERICKTAKEMGYVPNASARMLKNKKSYTIGVLFVDATGTGLKHEFFSSIFDSIKLAAEKKGYDLTFISDSSFGAQKMSYLDHVRYRNIDGVVIASANFKSQEIIDLVNSDIPTVTIDYVFNDSTAVLSDNADGLGTLVNYAANMGHKNIAFIHGEVTEVTNKRIAGFYKAMQDNKLTVNENWVKTGDYHDPKTSGKLTKELLEDRFNIPDCIIYPDDVSLIGGMTAIEQMGYKIPQDISVIGYDGVNISRILRPVVTTYVQASEDMGRIACEKLIDRIEKESTFIPEVIKVEGHLQEGNTVSKK